MRGDSSPEVLPAYLTRRTAADRQALLAAWEAQTRWLFEPSEDSNSEPPEHNLTHSRGIEEHDIQEAVLRPALFLRRSGSQGAPQLFSSSGRHVALPISPRTRGIPGGSRARAGQVQASAAAQP